MPYVRAEYIAQIRPLLYRQRVRRLLEIHLHFHPYRNPHVTAGWLTDQLVAEFDYDSPEWDPECDHSCTMLKVHLLEFITGRKGIPYFKRDQVLGPLKFDGYWEGEFDWRGDRPVPFTIWPNVHTDLWNRVQRLIFGPPLPKQTVQFVQRVLRQLNTINQLCLDGAARDMLGIFNANWNDGSPLSAEEFRARLSLDNLRFWDNDMVHVCFNQDGLFTDHGVRVDLSNRLEVVQVTLEG